jgi:drug/metabolite transporter (DMT)-like permease
MLLWIFAIKHIGINEATALSYTGPFWVFLAARYVIGETFNLESLIATCINMVGVLIILRPNLEDLSFVGIGASVTSILLWVLYETICKKQTSSQHYMLQTFYVFLMAAIITAPFALQKWQPISLETFSVISLLSALSVLNVTSIFIAYLFAPMMIISPFSYARLVFTAILTNLVYHTSPHIEVFIGAAIILIANCWFTYYSIRNKKIIQKAIA